MNLKLIVIALLAFSIISTETASADEMRPTNIVRIEETPALQDPSSLAMAPNGDIWISDWSRDAVFLFAKNGLSGSSSIKSIAMFSSGQGSSSGSDASSIAVDTNGFVYVADATRNKIFIFDPSLGNSQFIEDATRIIDLGHRARVIALDSSGNIYAAGRDAGNLEVRIFTAGTSSGVSASPIRSFTDQSTNSTDDPYGVTVLPTGEVAIACYGQANIKIYSASASGQAVVPARTIAGSNTGLTTFVEAILSDYTGRIYAIDYGSTKIWIFDSGAAGDQAPSKVLKLKSSISPNLPAVVAGGSGSMILGKQSQIWVGDDTGFLVHFDNPFTLTDAIAPLSVSVVVDPEANIREAAKVAVAAHAAAVARAKIELSNNIHSGERISIEQLQNADIYGATTINLVLINQDLLKLDTERSGDIKEIERIVFKYATVDKIAEKKVIYANDLVSLGLIAEDSKFKTSILRTLKNTTATSIDTFEEIQTVIKLVEKEKAVRRARIDTVIAKTKAFQKIFPKN